MYGKSLIDKIISENQIPGMENPEKNPDNSTGIYNRKRPGIK
jgi:hypothetical protein